MDNFQGGRQNQRLLSFYGRLTDYLHRATPLRILLI